MATSEASPKHCSVMRLLELVLQNLPVIGHIASIFYRSRRESQTAVCRATFGLIGCIFEILNEMIRYKSMKLESPTKNLLSREQMFLNSEWMAAYPNHRVNTLWIPGSHNSGTYTIPEGMINAWSICQEFDIYTQLMIGVRYLDFRLITIDEVVYIAHRFRGRPFKFCLEDIQRFLQNHPSEVVVIRIDHNCSGGKCDVSCVLKVVKEHLSEFIVKQNECEALRHGKIPTISELTIDKDTGRVMLLSSGIDFSSLNAHQFSYKSSWIEYHCQYPLEWYSNYTDFLSTYQSKRKYAERDFVVMAGELTPKKNVVVQGVAGQIARGIGQCIGALWVEEQFKDLKDQCFAVNYQLKRFLKEQSFKNRRPIVISHDFLNPEIIQSILNLNDEKRQGNVMNLPI